MRTSVYGMLDAMELKQSWDDFYMYIENRNMNSRIYRILEHCINLFNINNPIQPPRVQACATMMSSSARAMVSAYQMSGSVTATRTVKMDPMKTTPVLPSPASLVISSVPTRSASHQAGCATVTMTAWTWVMKWTAQRLRFGALPSSGCAPPTRCASTWTKCATVKGTAQMVPMSQNCAVSSYMYHLTI